MPAYARQIVTRVADENGVRVADLLGPSHARRVSWPRQAAYVQLRDRGLSYPQIGRIMGRDHTSVLSGERAHRARAAALFLCIMARWAA